MKSILGIAESSGRNNDVGLVKTALADALRLPAMATRAQDSADVSCGLAERSIFDCDCRRSEGDGEAGG